MIRKIQKWGNSLGVRLPKELADQYALKAGSTVILTSAKRSISLQPATRSKKKLKELITEITPANRHEAIAWSRSRRKEVW